MHIETFILQTKDTIEFKKEQKKTLKGSVSSLVYLMDYLEVSDKRQSTGDRVRLHVPDDFFGCVAKNVIAAGIKITCNSS